MLSDAMDRMPLIPDGAWRQKLRRRLQSWFRKNARDLPWRRTSDPYLIWVSEIMLQQTQVETVKPYYERFIRRFPTVTSLAESSEREVLRFWEGLGYYRRARQLHRAAQIVCEQHGGCFPDDFEAALALPGIGRYTAGAILSIALDQRQPILEGNTIRLFSRLLGFHGDPRAAEGQRLLWTLAEAILPRKNVGELNQALMELGSEICRPTSPSCEICPLATLCPTQINHWQSLIPAKSKPVAYVEVQEAAVVVRRNGHVLLRRCADGERWAGLWDFPRFGVTGTPSPSQIGHGVQQMTGLKIDSPVLLTVLKHGVTRYRITLSCYEASYSAGRIRKQSECEWATPNRLQEYPLSVTGRRIGRLLTA